MYYSNIILPAIAALHGIDSYRYIGLAFAPEPDLASVTDDHLPWAQVRLAYADWVSTTASTLLGTSHVDINIWAHPARTSPEAFYQLVEDSRLAIQSITLRTGETWLLEREGTTTPSNATLLQHTLRFIIQTAR